MTIAQCLKPQVSQYRCLLAMGTLLVLSGCEITAPPSSSATGSPSDTTTTVTDAREVDSSPVIVTVNGEAVSEGDVQRMMARTFSQAEQMMLNDQVQQKVVQSLIASRAMMQVAKTELSADQVADIQSRVEAFEEELYVQAYLQQHAVPQPVTTAMVETYYHENPQLFGGLTVKSFEMLAAAQPLQDKQRDTLLENIASIKTNTNWKASRDTWQQHYNLNYREGDVMPGLLDPALERAIHTLEPGQVSDVLFLNGAPSIVRVTAHRTLPARPLSEVSGEIRKMLAPQQLRQAVKAVSEAVIANASIEYKSE